MAHQTVLGRVVTQSGITAPAFKDKAAVAALDKGGPSPPVKKQNHLLPVGQSTIYHLLKGAAEDAPVARLELFFHVDYGSPGQGGTFMGGQPLREFK